MSEPQKYVKRPVTIEAMQWDGTPESTNEITAWITGYGGERPWQAGDRLYIFTLEGEIAATPGDYVIRGIVDEFYPCKPDIFTETYRKKARSE